MHECVLIPESVSEVAWLEALQAALELRQGWSDDDAVTSTLSTFVGIVPTNDAKIAETYAFVNAVHSRPCILLDGDSDGRGYFDAVRTAKQPPPRVVFWPEDWAMEHVVAWIAEADLTTMLTSLGAALEEDFTELKALVDFLMTKKSYAPTHETIAVTLMSSPGCRTRTAQLLDALCEVLREPVTGGTGFFERVEADSTTAMHVFRFAPQ